MSVYTIIPPVNTKQTVKLKKLIDCHMLSVERDATDYYYMIFSTNITTAKQSAQNAIT